MWRMAVVEKDVFFWAQPSGGRRADLSSVISTGTPLCGTSAGSNGAVKDPGSPDGDSGHPRPRPHVFMVHTMTNMLCELKKGFF